MKNKLLVVILCLGLLVTALAGCGNSNDAQEPDTEVDTESPAVVESPADFQGEELSILVSAGWMDDNRYAPTIARFEETYGVTVDIQTIPADQYFDILHTKLDTGTCSDIFWIQSNPFAISSVIVDPETYCIDFTGEEWQSVIPEGRLSSCVYEDKLYGLQLWHNSPEFVMLYNKTLFDELGLEVPSTYAGFKDACAAIYAEGITPWFVPGADGWQHQLSFFQIGGSYERDQQGLYEALNNNETTFAENGDMLEVLNQFKELSDMGYFGEDWIGTDSTNVVNEYLDRTIAMSMQSSGFIKQLQEAGSTDEYGLFLIPFNDNDQYPTNPAGPTMFGYKGSEHPELVKEFFRFVCTTESLQEILDNSLYTNIAVNDSNVEQHWLPEEEVFVESISPENMVYPVLQTGTKYTNDFWMDFGADMIAFCQGQIEAVNVLENMDANRAEAAKVAGDPAWN